MKNNVCGANDRSGVAIAELLVAVGLMGALALATAGVFTFFLEKNKETEIKIETAISSALAQRVIANDLMGAALSLGNLSVESDQADCRFFDFQRDCNNACGCERNLTLEPGRGTISMITLANERSQEVTLSPALFHQSNLDLDFSGFETAISARLGSPFQNNQLLGFSTPDLWEDSQGQKRKGVFLAKVSGSSFLHYSFDSLNQNHPLMGSSYGGNISNFFKSLPGTSPTTTHVSVAPVTIVHYTIQQEGAREGPENNFLRRQILTASNTGALNFVDQVIANPITKLTFRRRDVRVSAVSFSLE